MSSTLNRTLATVLAAAATAGSPAVNAQTRAQTRGEDPAVARQRIADCYTLGKEKGVEKLPLTSKAIQQDRSAKLLGCVFSTAAGGEFVVTKGYDLADPKQATAYGTDSAKLRADETKAAEKLAKQGAKTDQNGNVIRDTAQETKKTVDDVGKTVKSVDSAAKTVDNVLKTFKRLGL